MNVYDRFAEAARDLCRMQGIDPDSRCYGRDAVAMPSGPTQEMLALGDLHRFVRVLFVIQKHSLDHFEFDKEQTR